MLLLLNLFKFKIINKLLPKKMLIKYTEIKIVVRVMINEIVVDFLIKKKNSENLMIVICVWPYCIM